MADRIQQRRDTEERWAQFNPVLLEGEVGYVTDKPNQYKIGDGVSAWNDLPLRGYDGTLVQTIEGGDQQAVVSQWGSYQSDRHLQAGKASLADVFGINNLLTQAEIWPGYTTGEDTSNPGTYKWTTSSQQCGGILKVKPGDVLIFQGWFPLWGFFAFGADDDNAFISKATSENISGKCYKITVPSDSTITRLCFTVYRSNNASISGQAPFDPQTAIIATYDADATYPIQRTLKPSLVTPVVNEALKQVKDDPEYFSKTNGQSNLLPKDYWAVFGFDNQLTEIIPGFQYANDNKKVVDANAAISNDIPVTGGQVLVVQGFWAKWGAYLTFMDENHEIIVTNYQTGLTAFGSVAQKTYGFYITVPAQIDGKTVAYAGLTLWRDNNNENNTLPFNPNYAIVTVAPVAPEVPLLNKLKDSLTFQKSQEFQDITEAITTTEISSRSITPTQAHVQGFINSQGEVKTDLGGYYHDVYNLEAGKSYVLVYARISGSGLYFINYYKSDGTFISGQQYLTPNGTHEAHDLFLIVPTGAAYCKINTGNTTSDFRNYESSYLNVGEFKADVDEALTDVVKIEQSPVDNGDGWYNNDGSHNDRFGGYYWQKFNIDATKKYLVSVTTLAGSGISFLVYFNEEGEAVGNQYPLTGTTMSLVDAELTIPSDAVSVIVNHQGGSDLANVSLNEAVEEYISVPALKADVDEALTDVVKIEQSPVDNGDGWYNNDGSHNDRFGGYYWQKFNIDATKKYLVSVTTLAGSGISFLVYFNEEGEAVGNQYPLTGTTMSLVDAELTIPSDAVSVIVNHQGGSDLANVSLNEAVEEYISVPALKADVDELMKNPTQGSKLTSILKNGNSIYIRSRFDATRDMVILYLVDNRNRNFSPNLAYLGDNTLTTMEIVATGWVHYTYDSTPPFLLQNYWYLFGEHGYYIPQVTSTGHNKDTTDLGSWWKTTDNIELQLVNINGNTLTFAPKITKNGSGEGKDSRGYTYGTPILGPLTWVSGGTHDDNIAVTSYSGYQWVPFEYNVTKKYFVDGREITQDGEYYGEEVKVVDIHEGLNPIAITQWTPVIQGDVMVRLSFTHRFVGLSVFVSNTIEVLYPMWLNYYGAFQPMGLRGITRSGKNYHAMIVIPKVKEASVEGKITVDWTMPQDCTTANQNWAKTTFGVNANDLLDVNNIPERIIEWQQVPDTQDYLIGFAAGYSMVSSLTRNEKRKDLVGTALQFSQDDRNKLYIRCVDTAKLTNSILPAGWIGNFNYYYSYFNPAENEAKVHWYKEGGEYIVYVHAFSELASTQINLPEFMDGCVVQGIVENTDGSELLTDTVSGSSLFAKFPAGSNYIVFRLR